MNNKGLKKLIYGKKNATVGVITYLHTNSLKLKNTTATNVGKSIEMTPCTIIKTLQNLEGMEILIRTKGLLDGRSVTWELSDKGKMIAYSLLSLNNTLREIENE